MVDKTRKEWERRPSVVNRTFHRLHDSRTGRRTPEVEESKTMERMVNGKLYHFMEDSGLLDENQAGFRRHRSTVDQLVLFTQSVINAWQCNQHTVTVLVDLKNAYDRIWRGGGMLLKLQRYGVNGRMYNWLKGFLSNRYIQYESKRRLFADKAFKGGTPTRERAKLYPAPVLPQRPQRGHPHFQPPVVRGRHFDMAINTTKTVYNIYSNSREVLARDPELKIEDKCLQRDPLPRYLCVALDSRLNLTAHVEQLAVRIGLMKKLAGTNWGATLSSLKTLYVTFVRSALEYANPILNLVSKTSLGKLDRIQNAAMRLLTGRLRSTPIAALEVATGCEPLETRREVQTLMTRERFLRRGESNPLKDLAESFGATRRRLKKVSVLSAAEAAERKFNLPTDRAPLETPGWPPELAPPPSGGSPRHWLERKKVGDCPPGPKSRSPRVHRLVPNRVRAMLHRRLGNGGHHRWWLWSLYRMEIPRSDPNVRPGGPENVQLRMRKSGTARVHPHTEGTA
ncbi:hypothetical protein RRG08_036267 [Elysia crispata]|uniref:Reverse transcriptase domain-containing protein n=1 Tax=Elysia crispata TaxID=231223 RepID=A0AAE0YXF0_9GAST|nr:hypothetical protein RRG08_036267 [Elysia crispata]